MAQVITDAMVGTLTQVLQLHIDDAATRNATVPTEELVRVVMTAYFSNLDGDPVGTVLQDPASGGIAQRISVDGVVKWSIRQNNGELAYDTRPTLPGWTDLVRPEG